MTTQEQDFPILIIGAGIGGLATALALQQAGFAVQIFEQTKEIRESGSGLTLWANAVWVLIVPLTEERVYWYSDLQYPGKRGREAGGTPKRIAGSVQELASSGQHTYQCDRSLGDSAQRYL